MASRFVHIKSCDIPDGKHNTPLWIQRNNIVYLQPTSKNKSETRVSLADGYEIRIHMSIKELLKLLEEDEEDILNSLCQTED